MYKIRLQRFYLKLATNGQSDKAFLLNFVHKELSASAPGLYTCEKTFKNVCKIRIQRDLFETCNKWSK